MFRQCKKESGTREKRTKDNLERSNAPAKLAAAAAVAGHVVSVGMHGKVVSYLFLKLSLG